MSVLSALCCWSSRIVTQGWALCAPAAPAESVGRCREVAWPACASTEDLGYGGVKVGGSSGLADHPSQGHAPPYRTAARRVPRLPGADSRSPREFTPAAVL